MISIPLSPVPAPLDSLQPGESVTLYYVSEMMASTAVLRGRFEAVRMTPYYVNGPVHPVVTMVSSGRRSRACAIRLREWAVLVRGHAGVKIDTDGAEGLAGRVFRGNACLNFVADRAEVAALLARNLNPLFKAAETVNLVTFRAEAGRVVDAVYTPYLEGEAAAE